MDNVIAHSWAPSTTKRYSSAVADFLKFCKRQDMPLTSIWPASEDLLCFYAASMARTLAGRMVSNKMSGLRSYHIQHDLLWHDSMRLRQTVKGVKNLRPDSSFQKEQPPATLEMLHIIKGALDLSKPWDACVWAVVTTAFWGQIRLGEFLPP